MEFGLVLIVAGVAALVGGVVWLGKIEEKQRTERMAEAARTLGFAFEAVGNLDALRSLGDLPVYGHGHQKRARNVLSGRAEGLDVKLLDYTYVIGSGKDQHAYAQSVLLVPGTHLPDLVLQPETVLDRVASAFGAQDIDFDASPEFSRAYRLSGPDEVRIRSAFSAEALAFFAREKHWTVEVRGGTAGIYRSQRLCRPDEVKGALAERRAVLRALVPD